MWYRVVELAYSRAALPMRAHRLARYLSQQQLDAGTGRVVGQWGTDRVDGGMALAHGYALTEEFGEDRFWDDLKLLYAHGYAERVVAPAPGRRAVYALVLRVDAIPQELPDDLARQLKVWDLPEYEVRYEDAQYGRLTAAGPVELAEPAAVPVDEQGVAALATAPRWEHPADSRAAAVAADIRTSAKALGTEAGPRDQRCWAVAERDRAEALSERLRGYGKTSPSYARAVSPLSGLLSADRRGLSSGEAIGTAKTKTTPSAAPEESARIPFGDDLGSVADRVQRRVWAAWRAQLGYSRVILRDGSREADSRSMTGSAWGDLHRTIMIALRRSTESELVEILSANVDGVDDLGRLAGWRLWRLINTRKDAHAYSPRRKVPQARHVDHWDNPHDAELARRRAAAEQAQTLMDARRRADDARIEAAAATRAELRDRWDLRRWAQEPEHLHTGQAQEREQARANQADHAQAAARHAAAVAKAREEKRARRNR